MATLNMDENDIVATLADLGLTGQARLHGIILSTRQENDAEWMFAGSVADEQEAQRTIDAYFA
jgi:hypothetical protein